MHHTSRGLRALARVRVSVLVSVDPRALLGSVALIHRLWVVGSGAQVRILVRCVMEGVQYMVNDASGVRWQAKWQDTRRHESSTGTRAIDDRSATLVLHALVPMRCVMEFCSVEISITRFGIFGTRDAGAKSQERSAERES